MISTCLRTALIPSGRTSHTGRRSMNPFTSCRRIKRNVIAESLLVHLDQALAVARFLGLHFLEDLRRSRIALPQSFGEVAVNAAVLFFELNGECENFPLASVP